MEMVEGEGVRYGNGLLERGSAFHSRVVAKECWRLGTFDQVSELFKHVL